MSIVYPSANAWVAPRSSEVKTTDQNCIIEPIQKIEKIDKILTHIDSEIHVFVYATAAGNYKKFEIKTKEIFYDRAKTKPFSDFLDILHFVVPKEEYDTLTKIEASEIKVFDKRYVSNSWYYTKERIVMPNALDVFGFGWEGYVWKNLAEDAFSYEIVRNGGFYVDYTDKNGKHQEWVSTESAYMVNVRFVANIPDLMSAQFRIYYTPLGESVKLQVPKTNPQINQFCIPYSQQQPIVDNVTLGREMQSIANRAGCETKEVVRTLHSMSEYRKPGTVYFEKDSSGNPTGNVWRLTSNHIEIYSSG